MSAHMLHAVEEDEMGFLVVHCTCGWSEGPLPDQETAIDSLMDHAAEAS